jgi:hypothetical protein
MNEVLVNGGTIAEAVVVISMVGIFCVGLSWFLLWWGNRK